MLIHAIIFVMSVIMVFMVNVRKHNNYYIGFASTIEKLRVFALEKWGLILFGCKILPSRDIKNYMIFVLL